jgi:hypothetical protein
MCGSLAKSNGDVVDRGFAGRRHKWWEWAEIVGNVAKQQSWLEDRGWGIITHYRMTVDAGSVDTGCYSGHWWMGGELELLKWDQRGWLLEI